MAWRAHDSPAQNQIVEILEDGWQETRAQWIDLVPNTRIKCWTVAVEPSKGLGSTPGDEGTRERRSKSSSVAIAMSYSEYSPTFFVEEKKPHLRIMEVCPKLSFGSYVLFTVFADSCSGVGAS